MRTEAAATNMPFEPIGHGRNHWEGALVTQRNMIIGAVILVAIVLLFLMLRGGTDTAVTTDPAPAADPAPATEPVAPEPAN